MAADRRTPRFLILYALANTGGVLAFLPLLTLLLPLKVQAMADAERLGLLTAITVAGAVAASLSNIGAGWLSDRSYAATGTRRGWIVAGLTLTLVSYAGIAWAATPTALLVAMVAYQAALNVMLGPLFTVMADLVPDAQKGVAGGLLALAAPLSSVAGGLVTGIAWLGDGGRLIAIGAGVVLCIAPLLASATLRRGVPDLAPPPDRPVRQRRDLPWVWLSRLAMQIANCVLFTYLLFVFDGIAPGVDRLTLASRIGHLTGLAFLVAALVAFIAGRASDRLQTRKPFLLGSAVATACGLAVMAAAGGWLAGAIGYALFAIGSASFLGLHSAYAMQVLPDPRHRGRDLGLLNLTNTLPALLGPMLTWSLANAGVFTPVLWLLAALAVLAGVLILPVRSTA